MLRSRLLRWLVLAAVLTAGTAVVGSGTAHACSCIVRELSEYADGVSVAFVGHQLALGVEDYFDDNGAVLLFGVDRVYKGEAGPLIEVRTHAQDSACGIDVGGRGTVGVVARQWRGDLSVNLCGSIVAIDELQEVFGEGYPPDESIQLPISPNPEEHALDTGQPPDDGLVISPQPEDPSRDQSPLAALIIAGAALLLLVCVVTWHRRR